MTTHRSPRGLLRVGGLSVGLVLVGVAFEVPFLPELGSLAVLTVLGVLALEGLRIGDSSGASEPAREPQRAAGKRPRRQVNGPVAALLVAGGIVGVGLAFELRSLVFLGSLLGLAVVGGLATLGVLASDVVSNGGDNTRGRG